MQNTRCIHTNSSERARKPHVTPRYSEPSCRSASALPLAEAVRGTPRGPAPPRSRAVTPLDAPAIPGDESRRRISGTGRDNAMPFRGSGSAREGRGAVRISRRWRPKRQRYAREKTRWRKTSSVHRRRFVCCLCATRGRDPRRESFARGFRLEFPQIRDGIRAYTFHA